MKLAHFEAGLDRPLFLIAGPCVVESETLVQEVAGRLKEITAAISMPLIFKASFDKANRTSVGGYRGPGLAEGLRILAGVKRAGHTILTDVHEPAQAEPVALVADILQIPAFLCRQTDLLVAAGRTGRIVNIKKGQFVAPQDMARAAVAVGIDGLFVEVHDAPERALSDGPNALRLDLLPELLRRLRALDGLVKSGYR